MVNLRYFEDEAGTFSRVQQELDHVESELEEIDAKLAEVEARPEPSLLDRLLGRGGSPRNYVDELEARQERLEDRRDRLAAEVDAARQRLRDLFSSEDLVVPLTQEPEQRQGAWVFEFEGAGEFDHTVEFLADEIGLGTPLRIEDVLVTETEIQVAEASGEAEAMEAARGAFEELKARLAED